MSRRALGLVCAALAVCFVIAADSLAGDGTAAAKQAKGKPAKVKQDAQPHLDFQRTYAAALREARVRNLPIFVSRHKDF